MTALAHPAPLNLCTNHGVFVFEDVNDVWKRYEDSKQMVLLEYSRWNNQPNHFRSSFSL